MFLATSETSVAGKYLSLFGMKLFGDEFRWIFSPILIILGGMILVKKASWSASRMTGIILYFLSVTSLIGMIKKDIIGFFDLHEQAVRFF